MYTEIGTLVPISPIFFFFYLFFYLFFYFFLSIIILRFFTLFSIFFSSFGVVLRASLVLDAVVMVVVAPCWLRHWLMVGLITVHVGNACHVHVPYQRVFCCIPCIEQPRCNVQQSILSRSSRRCFRFSPDFNSYLPPNAREKSWKCRSMKVRWLKRASFFRLVGNAIDSTLEDIRINKVYFLPLSLWIFVGIIQRDFIFLGKRWNLN